MRVEPLTPEYHSAWTAFVQSSPDATFYHQLGWKDLVESVYGLRSRYYLCFQDDQVVGILPLFEMRNLSWKRVLVSLPFANYGGIVSEHRGAEGLLVQKLSELVSAEGFRYGLLKYVREDAHDLTELPRVESYCSPFVRLPESEEAMFSQIKAKTRNQVRKGHKLGLTTTIGVNCEIRDQFYHVLCSRMRAHGTPGHGRHWFSGFERCLPGQYTYVIAHQGGRPLAGLMLLFFRSVTIVHYGASMPGSNVLCPNNVAYWAGIQEAIRRGYTVFDFGRSRYDSGTYHFKLQWGAEPVTTPYLYSLPEQGTIPNEDPTNPKYRAFSAIWQKLPLRLTTVVGPSIRKHITT